MQLFLKRLLIFLLLLALLAIVSEGLIFLRIKNKSLYGHDNLHLTKNNNASLLLLGGSRCLVQFNPAFFDTTFKVKSINLGVEGHAEIVAATLRLKNYLTQNKAPKFAIFSFDPFVNGNTIEQNKNMVTKNKFARYAFLPKPNNIPLLDYFKFNTAERYIPLYAMFKYNVIPDCLKPISDWNAYGFGMRTEQWDTVKIPVTNILVSTYFKESEIESIKSRLTELNNLCKENGIKLLCLQTPVYKSINVKKAFEITKQICQNLAIPFADLNMLDIAADKANFYDSNHLNILGVSALNKYLAKDTTLKYFFKL